MNNTKQQILKAIASLQENISRIESTIRANCWQKGYVANCNDTIAGYREQIDKWEAELTA